MIANWSGSRNQFDPATWTGGADRGLPHGHGTLEWANGVVHEGAMDRGLRQGTWVSKSSDGRWFSCQWANDELVGDWFGGVGDYKVNLPRPPGAAPGGERGVYVGLWWGLRRVPGRPVRATTAIGPAPPRARAGAPRSSDGRVQLAGRGRVRVVGGC